MSSALHADLVLTGATIITLDARDTPAQAVAVKGGTIVGVGSTADVEGLIGRGTRVLDLRGRTVVPGFVESHTHNTLVGEFRYSLTQLNTAAALNPTLDDLLAKVGARGRDAAGRVDRRAQLRPQRHARAALAHALGAGPRRARPPRAHHHNPEADRLLEAQSATTDMQRRIAIWQDLQRIWAQDVPIIWPYAMRTRYNGVLDPRVRG